LLAASAALEIAAVGGGSGFHSGGEAVESSNDKS